VTRPSHRYRILRSPAEVARMVARHVEQTAARATQRNGRFTLVLSGGSSPTRAYELIAQRGRVNWPDVHVFWSDERCVPPDHPDSNYHRSAATLFANGAPPRDHIHRIPAEHGPETAAAEYDQELAAFFQAKQPALRSQPAFDLVLLGMGEDGHTASLFPGGVGLSSPAWAAPAQAPPGVQPNQRVTLTLAAIAAASEVCFIVTGSNKQEMVTNVLTHQQAEFPAAQVTSRQRVSWLLDRDAGAKLIR
jgi:6-phosphogluconolactonase